MTKLFTTIELSMLPKIKDRHPILYFEHARIEVDASSIKVIQSDGSVITVPVALISTLLLGPGISITHAAIKTIASVNCLICWVGEDNLHYYSVGISPTHDMSRAHNQCKLAMGDETRTKVVRKMYSLRFPGIDLADKTIPEMMGMEGIRVRKIYSDYANQYHVDWRGRRYTPGNGDIDESVNKILTMMNHYLYALVTSVIYHLGYLPQIGFVHSAGNIPFSYDIADIYKSELTIRSAFVLSTECGGSVDYKRIIDKFRDVVIESKFMSRISSDIESVLNITQDAV